MSNPSYTPTTVANYEWFTLQWYDNTAFFLASYNYKLYLNGVMSSAPLTIISTTNLQFSPAFISGEQGPYTVRVYGTNGTFIYDKTASVSLNVNCFVKGTEILTAYDGYIPIEQLKIGDEIKIYGSEPKKIKYISVQTYINNQTYNQIHKIHGINGQIKDLFVSGGHSILVDELTNEQKEKTFAYWQFLHKIQDKFLLLSCVNENAEKINNSDKYELYHLILENENPHEQFGIYANGILTESMSEQQYYSHTLTCNVNNT